MEQPQGMLINSSKSICFFVFGNNCERISQQRDASIFVIMSIITVTTTTTTTTTNTTTPSLI